MIVYSMPAIDNLLASISLLLDILEGLIQEDLYSASPTLLVSPNVYQLSLTKPRGQREVWWPIMRLQTTPSYQLQFCLLKFFGTSSTWQCILKTEKPHVQLKYWLYADIGGMLQYLTVHCGPKYALTLRSCTRWRPWQLKQEGCQ